MNAPPSATVERLMFLAVEFASRGVARMAVFSLPRISQFDRDAALQHEQKARDNLEASLRAALAALPRAPEVQRLAEAAFKANYRAGMNGLIDDHTAAAAEAAVRQALAAPPVDGEWNAAIEAAKAPAKALWTKWADTAQRNEADGYPAIAEKCWARQDIAHQIFDEISALSRPAHPVRDGWAPITEADRQISPSFFGGKWHQTADGWEWHEYIAFWSAGMQSFCDNQSGEKIDLDWKRALPTPAPMPPARPAAED